VRLCLDCGHGAIVTPTRDIRVSRAMVEWYVQEKNREKPVPVPSCLPQIAHGLTRVWTSVSAVTGWRLTARTMAIKWLPYTVKIFYASRTCEEMLWVGLPTVPDWPGQSWNWTRYPESRIGHTRDAKCPGIREQIHQRIYSFDPSTRGITYLKQNCGYSEYSI
jgi:hypothetical protein